MKFCVQLGKNPTDTMCGQAGEGKMCLEHLFISNINDFRMVEAHAMTRSDFQCLLPRNATSVACRIDWMKTGE